MKTRSKVYETSESTNQTESQNDTSKLQVNLNNSEIPSSESQIAPMVCGIRLLFWFI